MFCIKCGETLPDDALFCGKCGNKVPESLISLNTDLVEQAHGESLQGIHNKELDIDNNENENNVKSPKNDFSLSEKIINNRKKIILFFSIITLVLICVLVLRGIGYSKRNIGSSFSAQENCEFLFCRNETSALIMGDSGSISVPIDFIPLSIADNGIIIGTSGSKLLMLNNNGMVTITENLNNLNDCRLCGSGEKVIFRENNGYIYSYDTKSGHSEKIYENAYIDTVSYNGETVSFSDGYIKVRFLAPTQTGAELFEGTDNLGEHVYCTIVAEYNREYGKLPTSFWDLDVGSNVNYSSSTEIKNSESNICKITTHNGNYSEILYVYDNDTYYYCNKDNKLVADNSILFPVQSICMPKLFPMSLSEHYNGDDSVICNFLRGGIYPVGDDGNGWGFDIIHSMDTIKKGVFCSFNDVESDSKSVSLVYIDEDLNLVTLVPEIFSDPTISKDKKKIYVASKDTIYSVDLSGDKPIVRSYYVGNLLIYDNCSLPIIAGEEDTVYYMTDFYVNERKVIHGTLFSIRSDMVSPQTIDEDVSWYDTNSQGCLFYISGVTQEEIGTVYSYSKNVKNQLTNNAYGFIVSGKYIYVLTPDDYGNSRGNLVKYGDNSTENIMTQIETVYNLRRCL